MYKNLCKYTKYKRYLMQFTDTKVTNTENNVPM